MSLPDECWLCCSTKPSDSGDDLCEECRKSVDRSADLAMRAMDSGEVSCQGCGSAVNKTEVVKCEKCGAEQLCKCCIQDHNCG